MRVNCADVMLTQESREIEIKLEASHNILNARQWRLNPRWSGNPPANCRYAVEDPPCWPFGIPIINKNDWAHLSGGQHFLRQVYDDLVYTSDRREVPRNYKKIASIHDRFCRRPAGGIHPVYFVIGGLENPLLSYQKIRKYYLYDGK